MGSFSIPCPTDRTPLPADAEKGSNEPWVPSIPTEV